MGNNTTGPDASRGPNNAKHGRKESLAGAPSGGGVRGRTASGGATVGGKPEEGGAAAVEAKEQAIAARRRAADALLKEGSEVLRIRSSDSRAVKKAVRNGRLSQMLLRGGGEHSHC